MTLTSSVRRNSSTRHSPTVPIGPMSAAAVTMPSSRSPVAMLGRARRHASSSATSKASASCGPTGETGDQRLEGRSVAGHDREARAEFGKGDGDAAADALAGAGHDDAPTGEASCHGLNTGRGPVPALGMRAGRRAERSDPCHELPCAASTQDHA